MNMHRLEMLARRGVGLTQAGRTRRAIPNDASDAHDVDRRRRTGLGRRGSIAVEFAFVAPIMLTMAAGTMQFGWLIFLQNSMLDATRNVARMVSVGTVAVEDAEDALLAALDNYPYSFAPDTADSADSVTITVTLPSAEAVLVDFGEMFEGWTLSASVTMPKET